MKSLPIAAGPPGAITVTTGSSLPGGPQRLRRNRKTGTFAELSEHLQNPPPCRHKRDRWMSPGYESDPVKGVGLRDPNIIGAQFVGFDLDGPAGIGEPVGQIEATLAALPDGAAFIATTTWSSSEKSAPGHRRWRLFLPLNREVTGPEHRRIWGAVADTLGLRQRSDPKAAPSTLFYIGRPDGDDGWHRFQDGLPLDADAVLAHAVQPVAALEYAEPTEAVALRQRLYREALDRLGPAVENHHGHDGTLKAHLFRWTHGLTEAEAWPVIVEWNRTNRPPWSEAELRGKTISDEKARENGYVWGGELPSVCVIDDAPLADETVDRDGLSAALARHRGELVVLLAPMGAGKTFGSVAFGKTGERFTAVFPFRRLVDDTVTKYDLADYREAIDADHVAVCGPSLRKRSDLGPVVFIDEAPLMLHQLRGGRNFAAHVEALRGALQAPTCIVAAADITQRHVAILESLSGRVPVIIELKPPQPLARELRLSHDGNAVRRAIQNALADGDRVAVACTRKDEAEQLHEHLTSRASPSVW